MFTVAVSAFARVPLQTAIDYVADFRNAPQWQRGLTGVEVDAPFPQAKHVIEVRRFLGRRIEAPGDLVDWIPGDGSPCAVTPARSESNPATASPARGAARGSA